MTQTQNLEPGDIVMCIVEKIVGTTVFVNIEGIGEGSIILSEIAPGRIRNLRDYVVPKKRIICKVLRVSGNRVDLSLRRVTPKEQKEIKESYDLERGCRSVLKSVLGEESDFIISEIQKKETVLEFCERAKKNPADLEKMAGKEKAKKIQDILNTQKKKKISIKKEFRLKTSQSNGLELIKSILSKVNSVDVLYISAGKYILRAESSDPKATDQEFRKILENLEKSSKNLGLEFSIS